VSGVSKQMTEDRKQKSEKVNHLQVLLSFFWPLFSESGHLIRLRRNTWNLKNWLIQINKI